MPNTIALERGDTRDRGARESPFRGGVIGCGFFAANQLHAWSEIEGVEIVAVCDRDRGKAEAAAARHGIAAIHDDAEAMLRSEALDFVDVVTTVESHRPLVEAAARHRLPVICQKPFAETLEDARAMVAACEKASVPLLVHENFRWQKPFRLISRLIGEGVTGEPFFARFSFRHGYDNYRNQPYLAEIERFSIMDVGLHLFDLARHLVGEVSDVFCRTQRLNPIVKGEDAFAASLGHANGAVSEIECSFFARHHPEPFPQTLARIEGPRATLELLEDYRLKIHRPGNLEVIDVAPPVPAWGAPPWHAIQESVIAIQRHWREVLSAGTEPQPSGAHNVRTLAVALACYQSAETGRRVVLDDIVPAGAAAGH